ncbi:MULTISPECIES: ABC transporter permease [Niastella]|uniref:ABC transporter permease n=1 Tax=Niastella soli TaxID=2821487 RepID=A0ABS3YYT9_9BACT|nr:ABC transporter permease [Niastella soli]MBO9203085.1 ABC transporter permease [Niastella soli]
MFKNYLIIAFRNLRKNKVSAIINIGGLAMGMAVAMLIGLWIYDELSFNKYHEHHSQIAQVMRHQDQQGDKITSFYHPMPLSEALQTTYKDVFRYVVISKQTEEHIISSGENKFVQAGNYMGPDAPEMLSLRMLYGSHGGLKDPNSILLSQSLAKKLFGNSDPTGRIVKIDDRLTVKVTGVYEDLPANSEFRYVTYIAPFELWVSGLRNKGMDARSDWRNYFVLIYAELAPGADVNRVSKMIKNTYLSHVDQKTADTKPELFLHPMDKWHLHSKFENGIASTSDQMMFLWFFSFIGVFVLLLACINFMNLSTARSEKRAREVGVRKAIGSLRGQLLAQFFCESLLVAAFSFVLAIVLVLLALPWFNKVAGKDISILWANPVFWLLGLVFTITTGLIAGSYPAFYLSSFNPILVLKGSFQAGRFASVPRKILVVLQFTVSIMLTASTIIVYRQIQFTKDRPVGYTRDGLLMFHLMAPGASGKYKLLSNELMNTGVVSGTAGAGGAVTEVWSMNRNFDWKGKDPSTDPSFVTLSVTQDYGSTIGWQLISGTGFSKEYASDSSGFVINEAAAKLMGLKDPVGEFVRWEPGWRKVGNFKILGVIKDMVMESPFEPAQPTIFTLDSVTRWMFVRINPAVSTSKALERIEPVFTSLFPAAPFDYKFADLEYAKKFASEERVGKLATLFSILAIFISCLGLFGLASFVAEQRTKEIGVRKVLGASVFGVWRLISKEFFMLVLIAFLIATPTAYFLMHNWLQSYQYRSGIPAWVFFIVGLGALLIALLTISYQTIKAALLSPAKSLKAE